ncbi:LysR family transcriptional regulator [Opitutaceae bacterium TAV4]|nr:LysR family transcriptional regulator [Opitutaceae bacterium TAV4]RRK01694.1 LysR family transcriptional regulator [Opitutaceae bacterium TAV3]
MNVHHLELFYHVALHGGISRAVRHMPWGIQQPAVSSQILQLEQDLGVRLFERIPFKLTPAGEELFAYAKPFFSGLDDIARRLRGEAAPRLRIAAAEVALRDHLPDVVAPLLKRDPRLRLTLRSGFQPEMEAWLLDREIDVAFVALENKPPARLRCEKLFRLPVVLLVHKKSPVREARDLWARAERGVIEEPLICLPPAEPVSRIFQKNMRRLGVEWPVSVEASSLGLITDYVAAGLGIGVSVGLPEVARHRDVRMMPLLDFEPLEIVALRRVVGRDEGGEVDALVGALLDEARKHAGKLAERRFLLGR